MNYSSKPLVTFFSLYLTLISTSLYSQTTDSIKGSYRYHRFTSDYQYLLFTVNGFIESQKIYDTHNKELVDWDNFPKDNYEPHASYNVYEGYDRKSYLLRYLSTVKNTGKERKSAYDQTGHNPLVTVSLKNFVRILPDGSFLCKEEKKRQRLEYYILSPDGKRRKLKHKFRSKFKSSTKMHFTHDGKYGIFGRFFVRGNDWNYAFEIQDMVSGSVLDFKRIENENVREISYVTDEYIIYDKSIVANWQGQKLFRINLNQRAGAITNVFQFNNILYILQQSRIRKGRGYLEKSTFSSFDTYSGTRIRSKIFHSAKDIVPIRDNEFMILYPFYNAHQAKNFDVNLRRGIGEGLAVAYINNFFETVEFTFLRKSTYKASKKKIGPAWPRWVSGLRPFDVIEHQGAYKMISYKQAFGFRLTDGSYVDYKDAKNQIKVAKHVDPNQFLCHCENKFCEGGYIQQSISTGNKFGTRIVDYYTTSTGNTYRRTTFFKPNRKTYSYKIKCSRCGGKGYKICKDKIKK